MEKSANIEVLYTELPWEKRFLAAKRDGFDYIEFWGWEDKDLPRVKALLQESDLSLSTMSGDGPFSMCDPMKKKEYIDYIKKSIDVANFLGSPRLVIHSNELADDPQWAADFFEEYSDTVKLLTMFDNLKVMSLLAEKAGVTFVLEALNIVVDHIGNFLTKTQTAVELVKATGSSHMKILYDAYHMYLNEGTICETLSKYIDAVGYIHVADAPGRGEPGTGAINYHNVFKHLAKIGYSGVIGFELYPQNGTKNAVTAILKACEGVF